MEKFLKQKDAIKIHVKPYKKITDKNEDEQS